MRSRIIKWVWRSAAAFVVATCVVAVAAMTNAGQRAAVVLLQSALSSGDSRVEIGALDGSLFSSGEIDRIALSDREGTWLEAREARFDWNPLALISGRIEINALSVDTLEVQRRPLASNTSDKSKGGSSLEVPAIAFLAKRLEVTDVVLGEALLGAAARLHVEGSANLVDQRRGLSASLTVTRTDGPGGNIGARLAYRADVRQLEIQANASEPEGGLLARAFELPGLPAIAFNATGDGPLDQWRAHWSLSASGKPFIAGQAAIDKSGDRHWLTSAFEGYLSPVLPAAYASLFAGKTSGSLRGFWEDAQRFEADAVSIKSAVLDFSAKGGFDAARAFIHGAARLQVVGADEGAVTLLLGDGSRVSFGALKAEAELPNVSGARRVSAQASVVNLQSPWGTLRDGSAAFSGGQSALAGASALAFDHGVATIALRGIAPADQRLGAAIGSSVDIEIEGSGSPRAGEIGAFSATAAAVNMTGKGKWDDRIVSLVADAVAKDISRFSQLAGERLTGSAALRIEASRRSKNDAVEIAIAGTGSDLGIGEAIDKRVLRGDTIFSGHIRATPGGEVRISDAKIAHPMLELKADGETEGDQVRADVEGRMADLSLLSPSLRGSLQVSGRLDGRSDDMRSSLALETKDASINGRPISRFDVTFSGAGPARDHRGRLAIDGTIDGRPLTGAAMWSAAGAGPGMVTAAAEDVAIRFASAELTGAVYKPAAGPPSGQLSLRAPNLAELSALSTKPIDGDLSARVALGGSGDHPQATFEAKSARSVFEGVKIANLQASGAFKDYLSAITGHGSVQIGSIETGDVIARDLRADIRETSSGLAFGVSGAAAGARLAMNGDLVQRGRTYAVNLGDLRLDKAEASIRLAAPAIIEITDGNADIKSLTLLSGGGRANVSGSAGAQKLALKVALTRFPAAIANAFQPELGLNGTIDGTLSANGTMEKPTASISVDWHTASAQATRTAQLPALDVSLQSEIRGNEFANKLTVRGRDGLSVSANGSGRLSSGVFIDQRISGEIPLALGNAAMAARGTRLGGRAVLDAQVSGPAEQPNLTGTIGVSQGTLVDPGSGLSLAAMSGQARLAGGRMLIERFQAKSEKGGDVTLSGSIAGLTTGKPIPRLAIRLAALKFNDNRLLAGEVDAEIAVNGPPDNLDASGTVYIRRLDVTVPNQLPRSVAALDLKHVNAPPHVQVAEQKAGGSRASSGVRSTINLDIDIEAADRIFVRGRGVDAQLGGGIAIRGDANRPAANGGFELVRGRLAILGRQLDFKRGRIAFNGSLDPYVDFEASAPADGVVVGVNVSGPLSRPDFRFSSTPELPEDEVVAKLLFNKSLASLSPLQIAQLASEIDKIGGLSSGPGILDQLKGSVGVDVLDIGSDKSGGATVSAGSYIDDKTYVGVEQGTTAGSSRAIIDHDLTKTLKARGEVGADGNSKIGIGVEWDY